MSDKIDDKTTVTKKSSEHEETANNSWKTDTSSNISEVPKTTLSSSTEIFGRNIVLPRTGLSVVEDNATATNESENRCNNETSEENMETESLQTCKENEKTNSYSKQRSVADKIVPRKFKHNRYKYNKKAELMCHGNKRALKLKASTNRSIIKYRDFVTLMKYRKYLLFTGSYSRVKYSRKSKSYKFIFQPFIRNRSVNFCFAIPFSANPRSDIIANPRRVQQRPVVGQFHSLRSGHRQIGIRTNEYNIGHTINQNQAFRGTDGISQVVTSATHYSTQSSNTYRHQNLTRGSQNALQANSSISNFGQDIPQPNIRGNSTLDLTGLRQIPRRISPVENIENIDVPQQNQRLMSHPFNINGAQRFVEVCQQNAAASNDNHEITDMTNSLSRLQTTCGQVQANSTKSSSDIQSKNSSTTGANKFWQTCIQTQNNGQNNSNTRMSVQNNEGQARRGMVSQTRAPASVKSTKPNEENEGAENGQYKKGDKKKDNDDKER